MTWLEFDSLVNARDVGGIPTCSGDAIKPGRLIRSDNLQDLTSADIAKILSIPVTDVIDLRSLYEVHHEGPGPLIGNPAVTFHQLSFFKEQNQTDEELPGTVLPWVGARPTIQVDDGFASTYLSFLVDRPDSVIGALRAIAYAEGAALVHCAAGKDRTGTTVALALLLVGADEDAVVADYAASSQRMQLIVDRLAAKPTYAANMAKRSTDSHLTQPHSMRAFLDYVGSEYGGVEPLLKRLGWQDADTEAMKGKLLG